MYILMYTLKSITDTTWEKYPLFLKALIAARNSFSMTRGGPEYARNVPNVTIILFQNIVRHERKVNHYLPSSSN